MIKKELLKKILPHFVAFILFTVVAFLYYYPVLEGKVLKANDSMVAKYSSKEIVDLRESTGEEALWTNSMFSGMPAYLISVKHPGNLFKKIDTLLRSYGMPVAVLFLALMGFYVALLMFNLNPWLALAGASAYGLSSFFFIILGAGHNTQAVALAYMAPMISGIWYTYRRDAVKGALFTGFILSLQILANHPQITYYALICLLIFGIVELTWAIREKQLIDFIKRSLILLIPFILAIGVNFSNLYTVNEYGKFSIRGKSDLVTNNPNASRGLDKDYITGWSYGISESFNLLIPNFKGGSSKPFDRDSETVNALRSNNMGQHAGELPKYWGTQPGTEGPHYLGAVMIFLFVLGLVTVRSRDKWWLLSATVLSVMLAWGKNFMPLTNFFIDFFPGYNKFRAVTMTLVIAQFCVPLLGMLALKEVFNGTLSKKDLLKGLKISTGAVGGLLLLFMIIPSLAGSFLNSYETDFPAWLKTALISDRQNLLRSDSFRSLAFVLLAAGSVFAFLSGKLKKEYAILVLGLLIAADLWPVDKRYLNADKFERPSAIQKSITPSPADNYILKDNSHERVLNLTISVFNDNSSTSYFHSSVGGYHGAKLRRYQELIDTSLSQDIDLMYAALSNSRTIEEVQKAFESTGSLNMLNTKYVIYDAGSPPLTNNEALGNAWFVNEAILVDNANEELSSVNRIDPSKVAVVDKQFSSSLPSTSFSVTEGESIKLISYKPNQLVYEYSAITEKLIVFSEIYYPKGWKAYIDNQPAAHFRANYVLRAMTAPAGKHEIRFEFKPDSYFKGNKISLASSVLLILLIAGYFAKSLVAAIKKKTLLNDQSH